MTRFIKRKCTTSNTTRNTRNTTRIIYQNRYLLQTHARRRKGLTFFFPNHQVRPSHEPNFYPYLPAHCTTPKEQKSLYISELPAKCVFAVPKNTKLLAVPLFELYGNEHKYGALIASIPHLVSRYQISLEEEEDAGEKE